MPNFVAFTDAEKTMEESIIRMREHLAFHKPLFRTAIEYGLMFSKIAYDYSSADFNSQDITYACGLGTIHCVSLNLRLGKNGSIIRDIGPIIEEMKEHSHYVFDKEDEYIEGGWKSWNFRYIGNGAKKNGKEEYNLHMLPQLMIRCFFENAIKCRKVGTGKFEEIMEVICEE
jgi:hypothetical protein